jgi:hypothetical protein
MSPYFAAITARRRVNVETPSASARTNVIALTFDHRSKRRQRFQLHRAWFGQSPDQWEAHWADLDCNKKMNRALIHDLARPRAAVMSVNCIDNRTVRIRNAGPLERIRVIPSNLQWSECNRRASSSTGSHPIACEARCFRGECRSQVP